MIKFSHPTRHFAWLANLKRRFRQDKHDFQDLQEKLMASC